LLLYNVYVARTRPSFVPAAPQRALRDLTRQRTQTTVDTVTTNYHKNSGEPLQKARRYFIAPQANWVNQFLSRQGKQLLSRYK
jgi:hypothetical protein